MASVGWFGAVLMTVWVASTAAPSDTAPRITPADRAEVDQEISQAADQAAPIVTDLNRDAERLRAHLDHPPSVPRPQRDPFNFGTPKTESSPAHVTTPAAAAPIVAAPPPVPRLVAILTDTGDSGIVRRVVLALGDEVHISKVGDTIGAYVVRSIGADAVELSEASSGRVVRVPLHEGRHEMSV
jgi:hypothetical protein